MLKFREKEVGRLPSKRSDRSIGKTGRLDIKFVQTRHVSEYEQLNFRGCLSIACIRSAPFYSALRTMYSSLELSRLETRAVLINPGEKRCAKSKLVILETRNVIGSFIQDRDDVRSSLFLFVYFLSFFNIDRNGGLFPYNG